MALAEDLVIAVYVSESSVHIRVSDSTQMRRIIVDELDSIEVVDSSLVLVLEFVLGENVLTESRAIVNDFNAKAVPLGHTGYLEHSCTKARSNVNEYRVFIEVKQFHRIQDLIQAFLSNVTIPDRCLALLQDFRLLDLVI